MPIWDRIKLRPGLALKMELALLTGAGLTLSATVALSGWQARQMIATDHDESMASLSAGMVARIGNRLASVEPVPRYQALQLSDTCPPRAQLAVMARRALESTPEAFGCSITRDPDACPGGQAGVVYCHREGQAVHEEWLPVKSHYYPVMDWYQIPRELGRPVWSEPFYDEATGVILSTFAVPFFHRAADGRQTVAGVAACVVNLDRLRKIVDSLGRTRGCTAFLLSSTGVFVTHPNTRLIMRESIFSLAESSGDPGLRRIGKEMVRGGQGVVRVENPRLGPSGQLYFAALPQQGWSLGLIYPDRELDAELKVLTLRQTGIAATGLGLLVLLVVWVARGITRPLRALALVTPELARGNLRVVVPEIRSHDEIGDLGRSFKAMTASLASLTGQVKGASLQLVATATEIAATSRQQEATISEFGASTTEVAAAVCQISATARELAKTMEGVTEVAGTTQKLAATGGGNLRAMEESMRRLAAATGAISQTLAGLLGRAEAITGLITTITKVADQTNLLSLNAAIEAEKAGPAGRGFVIVAHEIRRLADQTAVATLDIEKTVREMQDAVLAGSKEMAAFAVEVDQDVHTVRETGGQLARILEQVDQLLPRFDTVNDGMRAQAAGAEQIHLAMDQLNTGARQTSESLRQFKNATADLQAAAGSLQQEISRFET